LIFVLRTLDFGLWSSYCFSANQKRSGSKIIGRRPNL